jgi:hypothetical protein
MASAVFTGTVDFSTTILLFVDTDAIMRAAPSLLDVDTHTFGFVFDWTFELSIEHIVIVLGAVRARARQ